MNTILITVNNCTSSVFTNDYDVIDVVWKFPVNFLPRIEEKIINYKSYIKDGFKAEYIIFHTYIR